MDGLRNRGLRRRREEENPIALHLFFFFFGDTTPLARSGTSLSSSVVAGVFALRFQGLEYIYISKEATPSKGPRDKDARLPLLFFEPKKASASTASSRALPTAPPAEVPAAAEEEEPNKENAPTPSASVVEVQQWRQR